RMPAHIAETHPQAPPIAFRPLGPNTVAHIRATLRCALAVAMEWYELDRNVAAIAKPPRVPKKEMRTLTREAARKYLEAAAGDRLAALFTVAVALGLRQGEILGLGWENVDLQAGALNICRSLQRVDGKGLQLVETKSDEGERPLILPGMAISALHRHRVRQEEERAAAGAEWKESGLVFTSTIGTPLDDRNVSREHHKILKAAGIPP